jgi:hypothetical protein
VFPQLRPRKEYGKYEIEKYIRYFNLLISLKLIIILSRFKSFFISANNLFKFIQIHLSAVLIWIKTTITVINPILQRNPLPSREIIMQYYLSASDEIQLNRLFPDEKSKKTLSGKFFHESYAVIYDSRLYLINFIWRDELRRAMQFPRLR